MALFDQKLKAAPAHLGARGPRTHSHLGVLGWPGWGLHVRVLTCVAGPDKGPFLTIVITSFPGSQERILLSEWKPKLKLGDAGPQCPQSSVSRPSLHPGTAGNNWPRCQRVCPPRGREGPRAQDSLDVPDTVQTKPVDR